LFLKVITIVLIFNATAGAAEIGPEEKYQIVPLDASAEQVFKSSSLKPFVGPFDTDQINFHKKAAFAHKQISKFIEFKKIDSLYFIYDSYFLTESGFYSKYPTIPKEQLTKARKIASEVFSK
jgi:hypothetical protein